MMTDDRPRELAGAVKQTWSTKFEDPVPLPDGGTLLTLKQAAEYITKLSKTEQQKPHWQTATEILIGAAEGRDFLMHARIAMLKALNAGKPKPLRPPRRAKSYRVIR